MTKLEKFLTAALVGMSVMYIRKTAASANCTEHAPKQDESIRIRVEDLRNRLSEEKRVFEEEES